MFDPQTFLNDVTTEATSTTIINVPEGQYPGSVIEDLEAKVVSTKNGDRNILSCKWTIADNDGSVERATGREKNTVRQDIWLDCDEKGKLISEEGQNVSLGRLREALGQNNPGEAWNPQMLKGVPATPVVTHRSANNNLYAEIKSVLPLNAA